MIIGIFSSMSTASFRDQAEKMYRGFRRLGVSSSVHDFLDVFPIIPRFDKIIYMNSMFTPSFIPIRKMRLFTSSWSDIMLSMDCEGYPINLGPFRSLISRCRLYTPTFWCKKVFEESGLRVEGVIPRCIDHEELKVDEASIERFRESFKGKKILFSVYALHKSMKHQRKGVEEHLEALRILSNKGYDFVQVLLTNHDPEDLGIEVPREVRDRLVIDLNFGRYDKRQVALLYSACDVFVHPAHSGGFELPLVESMACKKPPVCIDFGVMSEVAGDYGLKVKVTGVEEQRFIDMILQVFGLYDPADLAEAIAYALDNQEWYSELGEKAYIYSYKFNYLEISKKYLEALRA
ncbi:MAG: glycosyltransferase [Nitrososphaerota archaeon]